MATINVTIPKKDGKSYESHSIELAKYLEFMQEHPNARLVPSTNKDNLQALYAVLISQARPEAGKINLSTEQVKALRTALGQLEAVAEATGIKLDTFKDEAAKMYLTDIVRESDSRQLGQVRQRRALKQVNAYVGFSPSQKTSRANWRFNRNVNFLARRNILIPQTADALKDYLPNREQYVTSSRMKSNRILNKLQKQYDALQYSGTKDKDGKIIPDAKKLAKYIKTLDKEYTKGRINDQDYSEYGLDLKWEVSGGTLVAKPTGKLKDFATAEQLNTQAFSSDGNAAFVAKKGTLAVAAGFATMTAISIFNHDGSAIVDSLSNIANTIGNGFTGLTDWWHDTIVQPFENALGIGHGSSGGSSPTTPVIPGPENTPTTPGPEITPSTPSQQGLSWGEKIGNFFGSKTTQAGIGAAIAVGSGAVLGYGMYRDSKKRDNVVQTYEDLAAMTPEQIKEYDKSHKISHEDAMKKLQPKYEEISASKNSGWQNIAGTPVDFKRKKGPDGKWQLVGKLPSGAIITTTPEELDKIHNDPKAQGTLLSDAETAHQKAVDEQKAKEEEKKKAKVEAYKKDESAKKVAAAKAKADKERCDIGLTTDYTSLSDKDKKAFEKKATDEILQALNDKSKKYVVIGGTSYDKSVVQAISAGASTSIRINKKLEGQKNPTPIPLSSIMEQEARKLAEKEETMESGA